MNLLGNFNQFAYSQINKLSIHYLILLFNIIYTFIFYIYNIKIPIINTLYVIIDDEFLIL